MKRLFRRKLLTVAAIVLMITSAMVSFFCVQENDRHVADSKRAEEKLDQQIRTLWESATAADRNADAAVIISLLAKDGSADTQELKRYYLARSGVDKPQATFRDLLKTSDAVRTRAVDDVNDLYLKRIALENEIATRESSAKLIADIAFLLQLFGLVLVVLTREMDHF